MVETRHDSIMPGVEGSAPVPRCHRSRLPDGGRACAEVHRACDLCALRDRQVIGATEILRRAHERETADVASAETNRRSSGASTSVRSRRQRPTRSRRVSFVPVHRSRLGESLIVGL
jgi:hypothetical protein